MSGPVRFASLHRINPLRTQPGQAQQAEILEVLLAVGSAVLSVGCLASAGQGFFEAVRADHRCFQKAKRMVLLSEWDSKIAALLIKVSDEKSLST